jgi:hypothetical protein
MPHHSLPGQPRPVLPHKATGLVDLTGWPAGTRLVLRKERPHPEAQLRTTVVDGMRITGFLTNHDAAEGEQRAPGCAVSGRSAGRGA